MQSREYVLIWAGFWAGWGLIRKRKVQRSALLVIVWVTILFFLSTLALRWTLVLLEINTISSNHDQSALHDERQSRRSSGTTQRGTWGTWPQRATYEGTSDFTSRYHAAAGDKRLRKSTGCFKSQLRWPITGTGCPTRKKVCTVGNGARKLRLRQS